MPMGRGSMPNSSLPNSYLERKQPVVCPIAILSANSQLLLDCFEEVKDFRKGNLLGLFFFSWILRFSCHPLSQAAFLSMVMEHCALSQCGISKLSFSEAGYTVSHNNCIRFLQIAIIPFICRHHGNGCYWLRIDLENVHYTNNTLIVF